MTNCARYEECGRDGYTKDAEGTLLCIPHLKGADLGKPKPKRAPRKRAAKKTTAKRAASRTPTQTTEAVTQTTEAQGEVTS